MEIIRNRIPGIVKVEYFDLLLLDSDRIDLDAMIGVFPRMPEKTYEIPLIGTGTAESVWQNGAESCSLSFNSDSKINPKFRPGFIITDAEGTIHMIASACKPFPSMEIRQSFGKMPDERPQYQYSIKHSALKTPVPVIE